MKRLQRRLQTDRIGSVCSRMSAGDEGRGIEKGYEGIRRGRNGR